MTDLIPALLRRRARRAGADPLLTYYEPATATRIELSAVTLLNWVDKTSHLLDELGVGAGDAVELALATTAPGHWVTAVWQLACWQVGAPVVVGPGLAEPRLRVTGPDWAAADLDDGAELVACSLHPLGLPLPEPPPPHVTDYALEVRGQADTYPARPPAATALAWLDADRRLTQADLLAGAAGAPARRLVLSGTPWETARAAVVAPLRDGGSTVLVAGGATADQLARIRRDERAEL
ncbi:TIGR03089 family protein [uncultured Friedmanniella sp.]|uniref:TIGR03089 family protein n=1 Tax=uncultured Friedmanniella sp. TaxID=335381 RepID=UPI0035CA1F13